MHSLRRLPRREPAHARDPAGAISRVAALDYSRLEGAEVRLRWLVSAGGVDGDFEVELDIVAV